MKKLMAIFSSVGSDTPTVGTGKKTGRKKDVKPSFALHY
jgi:hypothetical protein